MERKWDDEIVRTVPAQQKHLADASKHPCMIFRRVPVRVQRHVVAMASLNYLVAMDQLRLSRVRLSLSCTDDFETKF